VTFRRTRKAKEVTAVKDLSLEVRDQEFVVVVGPSGCGKTTLLRVVNGLIKPDRGTVRVNGARPRPGPEMGFVFQSFRLIPWLTIRSNIAFPMKMAGMRRDIRRERTGRYLDLVGLSKFADAYPSELSGGMKQRAALARALAIEPSILLMDEPFASIDAQTRELMQTELMRLWSIRKSIVLFVTHSVDEAVLLADKIVLLSPRPGSVLNIIDVDLPRPRWDYDVRAHPQFTELRAYLWDSIRNMVMTDPESDFFGRSFGFDAGASGQRPPPADRN
jgi:NitT/TauT family transport system ATP-binding protein